MIVKNRPWRSAPLCLIAPVLAVLLASPRMAGTSSSPRLIPEGTVTLGLEISKAGERKLIPSGDSISLNRFTFDESSVHPQDGSTKIGPGPIGMKFAAGFIAVSGLPPGALALSAGSGEVHVPQRSARDGSRIEYSDDRPLDLVERGQYVETMFLLRPGFPDWVHCQVIICSSAFPRSSSLSEKPVPRALPERQRLRGVITQIEGFAADHGLGIVGDKPAGGLTSHRIGSRPQGIAQHRTS